MTGSLPVDLLLHADKLHLESGMFILKRSQLGEYGYIGRDDWCVGRSYFQMRGYIL